MSSFYENEKELLTGWSHDGVPIFTAASAIYSVINTPLSPSATAPYGYRLGYTLTDLGHI